jgi:hypothetical protein
MFTINCSSRYDEGEEGVEFLRREMMVLSPTRKSEHLSQIG